MIKAIFVIGPTASGKTSLGIALAKKYNGEIISADSMQIYKGIHIASAAPDTEEKEGIEHHLIEFLDTSCSYSVADYVKKARECINDINSRGKLPIIVGGTGLYISALLDNIKFTEQQTDIDLRERLEMEFEELGAEKMLEKLREFDKETADRLHPNNKRRIIRAFEVYYSTGITVSEQNLLSKQEKGNINPLILGINFADREKLYDRINRRVDIMLNRGLLEEAKQTYSKKPSNNGAFQAIGHKEFYPYFDGNCSFETATENLKMSTRRYAKRQITWFKRIENVNWLLADCEDIKAKAIELANNFLKEE